MYLSIIMVSGSQCKEGTDLSRKADFFNLKTCLNKPGYQAEGVDMVYEDLKGIDDVCRQQH